MTNPLSVKTKVHVPRSPSAQLSAKERTKVFLEVHIQNLTPEPMWFERIVLEPALGWDVQDVNLLPDGQHTLFSGPMAMMQPQDTRQYLYVLNETNPPSIPTQYAPGTVLPLGRLDISWRSSFGEPGRLLTSVSVFVEFRCSVYLNNHNRCCRVESQSRQIHHLLVHSNNSICLLSRFISSAQPQLLAFPPARHHARAPHQQAVQHPIVLPRLSATVRCPSLHHGHRVP